MLPLDAELGNSFEVHASESAIRRQHNFHSYEILIYFNEIEICDGRTWVQLQVNERSKEVLYRLRSLSGLLGLLP